MDEAGPVDYSLWCLGLPVRTCSLSKLMSTFWQSAMRACGPHVWTAAAVVCSDCTFILASFCLFCIISFWFVSTSIDHACLLLLFWDWSMTERELEVRPMDWTRRLLGECHQPYPFGRTSSSSWRQWGERASISLVDGDHQPPSILANHQTQNAQADHSSAATTAAAAPTFRVYCELTIETTESGWLIPSIRLGWWLSAHSAQQWMNKNRIDCQSPQEYDQNNQLESYWFQIIIAILGTNFDQISSSIQNCRALWSSIFCCFVGIKVS